MRAHRASPEKQRVLDAFSAHVSSGKAEFFHSCGMDFVMGRREGPWLQDMDGGKRLYNLHCNGGVFNLGHRDPRIMAAHSEAMEEMDIGNHHLMSRARAELATRLAGLLPGELSYTVFGVSGGEAVDLAIKVARAATQRATIVSARGGYHGHTGLALAAGDEKYRLPFGPAAPGFEQVRFGDLTDMARAVNEKTAAVILETVPATLGMVIPPEDYLRGCVGSATSTGRSSYWTRSRPGWADRESSGHSSTSAWSPTSWFSARDCPAACTPSRQRCCAATWRPSSIPIPSFTSPLSAEPRSAAALLSGSWRSQASPPFSPTSTILPASFTRESTGSCAGIAACSRASDSSGF